MDELIKVEQFSLCACKNKGYHIYDTIKQNV